MLSEAAATSITQPDGRNAIALRRGTDMTVITASRKVAGVTEGQTLTLNSQHGVLAGDKDSSGFLLSVTAVSTVTNSVAVSGGSASIQGIYGTLIMHADGSYSYAAQNNIALPADGVVQDSFTFSVADSHGNSVQASLTIAVMRAGLQYIAGTPGHILTGSNGPAAFDESHVDQTVVAKNGN